MIREVYGHLGSIRVRSEAVEYRVQKHRAILKARLTAMLRSGCAKGARNDAVVAA